MLHTEHAYCLSYRFLNNVVITTVIEMVEMAEILDGRLGKRSVEGVRYVIYHLLHLVIVKYGDISLVLCISTRLRLVTILSLLVKYLVILHADPCNKSYISREISIEHPSVGLASLAQLFIYIFTWMYKKICHTCVTSKILLHPVDHLSLIVTMYWTTFCMNYIQIVVFLYIILRVTFFLCQ